MDNNYLMDLIEEAQNRGGGMLLNFNGRPAAVVLTVDKYNQLINGLGGQAASADQQELAIPRANVRQKVLVTGGAGFIGSHLTRELIRSGFKVTVLDNLSSGRRENVPAEAEFVEGDLADLNLLRDMLASGNFDAVFHLAASIEVEESVTDPQKYLTNNLENTGKLLAAMNEAGVKKIIFSSTAAVYGEQDTVPIAETAELKPNNPYGLSKALAEKTIEYYCKYAGFRAVVFRYFNACGCDYDGKIQPTHESHLIPIVLKAAGGAIPFLTIHGNDYRTFDGTCVRDYVHVLDIAKAHIKALDKIDQGDSFRAINIGTGKGLSVLQIVNGTAEVLNKIIPMEMGPRRPGDAAVTIADNQKLLNELGYAPQHSDLETIIQTSWNQALKKSNPDF